jgi:hypothetical protein
MCHLKKGLVQRAESSTLLRGCEGEKVHQPASGAVRLNVRIGRAEFYIASRRAFVRQPEKTILAALINPG